MRSANNSDNTVNSEPGKLQAKGGVSDFDFPSAILSAGWKTNGKTDAEGFIQTKPIKLQNGSSIWLSIKDDNQVWEEQLPMAAKLNWKYADQSGSEEFPPIRAGYIPTPAQAGSYLRDVWIDQFSQLK